MTRHRALALLAGARESHTLSPAMAAMVDEALRSHPHEHVQSGRCLLGLLECRIYLKALDVLGIGGAA